jgi:pimeloyl-ACP methyl ester carboxylesterase
VKGLTMARRNMLPFLLASATGALTVATAIQYRKHRTANLKALAEGSTVIDTTLGPVEVGIAGKGDPVLVIHGILGSYQQGLVIGEPLVDGGYQVIAPSRFGYVRSPLPANGSPAAQADLFAALLDVLKIKQAVVVGVSAGGPSAAEFAIRHPERTRALIMLAAVSQQRDTDLEEQHTQAMSMLLFGYTNDVALWLMLHYALRIIPFAVSERPSLQNLLDRPALMSMYERLLWGLWPAANRRAGADNDIVQIKRLKLALKKISTPTVVVHGTADQLVPFETGLYTASQIPGARLMRFEGGEHGLSVLQYDDVWPPLLEFIASARKSAPKRAAKPAAPRKPARAVKPAAPPRPSRPRKPAATPGRRPAR